MKAAKEDQTRPNRVPKKSIENDNISKANGGLLNVLGGKKLIVLDKNVWKNVKK